ncbi:MAG: sulfate ABC transporter substrate-binding protein [Armatimonadota bacterium]|nr:sulfate ABC transporter substrate-binding protein [Armatimonadota bacterium]
MMAAAVTGCSSPKKSGVGGVNLLNVSYDPTQEFYTDYDAAFASYWQDKSGQSVTVQQSHGGSGKQAQAVRNGLDADVVTLGIASDIDALAKAGLVKADWQKRLPNNSAPYTSTVVFLVRKGNPKGIKDWPDLIKPGVAVITPNPKSSSGGRWSYLAAYGYALQQPGGSPDTAKAFITQLYKNVPILDPGARGSTVTFTQHHVGDVMLAWENEAYLVTTKLGKGQYDIVYPSVSILAEPPVAVVDKNVDAHGTRPVAEAYLNYLYMPEGQEIAAKHFYRPRLDAVAKKYGAQFPPIKLFTVEKVFGSLTSAQKTHFADGGLFDQIYAKH